MYQVVEFRCYTVYSNPWSRSLVMELYALRGDRNVRLHRVIARPGISYPWGAEILGRIHRSRASNAGGCDILGRRIRGGGGDAK